MKVNLPKPFTFEAGPRAVLLLHGFTGHTADVRMLGRFLEKKGYTCHAPIYRGHGREPEALLESNANEWWEDAKNGLDFLKGLGYEEVAVAGLSLGGVFALKLGFSTQLKGIISMCTPMYFDNEEQLTHGIRKFSKEFKQLEKKNPASIDEEVESIMDHTDELLKELDVVITDVKKEIDTIYTPTFVVQASNDEMINKESANFIYNNIQSDEKEIKWYEESSHVITLDKQKDELHEDVYQFLEQLDWTV